ncbi:hypothetical protein [Klebsiella variicola]|uniref:hypothetical protein n=1 Tax=Klebsiella variicola TaxID=244366 RepID=UPI001E2F443A|nr:hypothetical protein [Klebsiella variicola]
MIMLLPTSAVERAGVCDYEHYAEASDYDFDSSIYDDYAMPQRLRRNRAIRKRTHHEHEHSMKRAMNLMEQTDKRKQDKLKFDPGN